MRRINTSYQNRRGMAKGFNYVSPQDYHGLRAAFLIILFWVAIWNLVEEGMEWIETQTNLTRIHFYIVLFYYLLLDLLFSTRIHLKGLLSNIRKSMRA